VSRPNSTADAHYLIYDGTPTLFSEPAASCTINQTSRTGEWIYCGTATLTQGNNAYVALGNDCEPNKEVVADAIRFVKQKTSLVFKGEWANGTTYGLDDVASYNGSSYVSLIDPNTGNQPDTSTTAWTLLAQTGAAGPRGPQGPQGAQGETGPAGSTGVGLNPTQIALLRWYSSNSSFSAITVGSLPQSLAFDGTNIWVANYGSNTIARYNAATGTIVASAIASGSLPEQTSKSSVTLSEVSLRIAMLFQYLFPLFSRAFLPFRE
jgi:hypothetical protein